MHCIVAVSLESLAGPTVRYVACCIPGVLDKDLYADTIASLLDYFGDHNTLADVLNVKVEDLRDWAEGTSRPPVDVFLRAANIKSEVAKQ